VFDLAIRTARDAGEPELARALEEERDSRATARPPD
jgi:hypothetical protein